MASADGLSPLVVLAGDAAFLFDPVIEALAARGCRIDWYRTASDFMSAPRALDGASVFYGYGGYPLGRDRLELAPLLRAIISPYTGTEGFDEEAATDLGILVGNGQVDENWIGMAEAAVLLVLASLYDLMGRSRAMRPWNAQAPLDARMLHGKTVGLLGFGRIARAVVARLEPWGARFIAHTPRPPEHPSVSFVPLDALLSDSDVLCVLAPLNAETDGLLSGERLAQTKRGSVLVVLSRGRIVDEEAAVALAREGHFLRVAFDVFAEEPYPENGPLLSLDNAVLTPHSVGHSRELLDSLPRAGIESILAVLAGQVPPRVRNPEIVEAWRARWSVVAAR